MSPEIKSQPEFSVTRVGNKKGIWPVRWGYYSVHKDGQEIYEGWCLNHKHAEGKAVRALAKNDGKES